MVWGPVVNLEHKGQGRMMGVRGGLVAVVAEVLDRSLRRSC